MGERRKRGGRARLDSQWVTHSREEGRGTDPFGSRNQKGPSIPGVHGVHGHHETIGQRLQITGAASPQAVPSDRKGVELGGGLLPTPREFCASTRYPPHQPSLSANVGT